MTPSVRLTHRLEELLILDSAGRGGAITEWAQRGAEAALTHARAYALGYVLSMLEHACFLSDRVEEYVRGSVADLERRVGVGEVDEVPK